MVKVLIPLPSYGFDPTEAAIPWKILTENNIKVLFATPDRKKAEGDHIMLTGEGLGLFKKVLMARQDAVDAYKEMSGSYEFLNPIGYKDIQPAEFDGLFLPGGHDKGVRVYLESAKLQSIIPLFFESAKPVAAVCHGVLLLARSKDSKTGKSVLYNRTTTSLLKSQERLAYNLTRLWLGDYYLTYPETTVEDEVKKVLKSKKQFVRGPISILRDSPKKPNRGFVVKDRNYVSGRWPGDIYSLSFTFLRMLQEEFSRGV